MTTSPQVPEMLTVAEAAEQLRVSKSFLNRLRVQGGGPQFIKLGRRVLYDARDLGVWANFRKRSCTQ